MTVRCLTIHARYACEHSGACCTAGWPIPVEADRLTAIRGALDRGDLVGRSSLRPLWLSPEDAPTDTPALLRFDHHGCVFYDIADGGRCLVHRSLGHDALPVACRQFPRVSVLDPRGGSVTLSHYCPTARRLLEAATAIEITETPQAFPPGTELVGLDVRTGLPPLLAPDMLLDWETWWEWERLAVKTIARRDLSPREALATLSGVVERVRVWRPGGEPLSTLISRAIQDATPDAAHVPPTLPFSEVLSAALAAVPPELRPEPAAALAVPPSETTLRGFIASHAFANWTAHLGQGLRSWLRSVEAAWTLAVALGVDRADLILRHLADPHALARAWSRAEIER